MTKRGAFVLFALPPKIGMSYLTKLTNNLNKIKQTLVPCGLTMPINVFISFF
jgi:hypothetical protein